TVAIPAAAAQYHLRATCLVEFGTPVPDVAVHVVEAQPVRPVRPHLRRPRQVRTLSRRAERILTVEVGLVGREGVRRPVEIEVAGTVSLGSGPSATGVFPFRFCRQAVPPATTALSLVQLLDELLGVLPRDPLHRELLQVLIGHVLDPVLLPAGAG